MRSHQRLGRRCCRGTPHLNSADSPTCKGGHEVVHYDGSTKGIALAKAIDAQFDLITEFGRSQHPNALRQPWRRVFAGHHLPGSDCGRGFLSVDSDVRFIRKG